MIKLPADIYKHFSRKVSYEENSEEDLHSEEPLYSSERTSTSDSDDCSTGVSSDSESPEVNTERVRVQDSETTSTMQAETDHQFQRKY